MSNISKIIKEVESGENMAFFGRKKKLRQYYECKVPAWRDQIKKHTEIFEQTSDVDVFFSTYNELLNIFDKLAQAEDVINTEGMQSGALRQKFIRQAPEAVEGLINRQYEALVSNYDTNEERLEACKKMFGIVWQNVDIDDEILAPTINKLEEENTKKINSAIEFQKRPKYKNLPTFTKAINMVYPSDENLFRTAINIAIYEGDISSEKLYKKLKLSKEESYPLLKKMLKEGVIKPGDVGNSFDVAMTREEFEEMQHLRDSQIFFLPD